MNGAPEQSLVAGEPDLAERIHRWAQRTPDKPALRFRDAEMTYAELDRQIGAVAGGLGLARGERIAFCATNRPEQLVLLFACARLGAICVPLNARLAPPELAHCLRDSGASTLVAEPSFLSGLAAHRADLPDLQRTVELDTEEWEVLLSSEAGVRRGCAADDLLIVYTSGTTGRPKGAVLTDRALSANAVNATQFHDLTSADHVLGGRSGELLLAAPTCSGPTGGTRRPPSRPSTAPAGSAPAMSATGCRTATSSSTTA